MRRRIRRQSPLTQQTRTHAENLLTASIPPEMQAVLAQLQDNLHNVNQLIDQKLRQTRELSALAYLELQTASPSTAVTPLPPVTTDEQAKAVNDVPQPANITSAMTEVNARQDALTQQINRKLVMLTQQIAVRTQQVSAQANLLANNTPQAAGKSSAGHGE